MKNEFKSYDRVVINDGSIFNGLTGFIIGRTVSLEANYYIVLLDMGKQVEEFGTIKGISVMDCCLSSVE